MFTNINIEEQMRLGLRRLAYYDALTGLPNRRLFNDHLGRALVQARREKNRVGVMFLDLDRFKNINDTLGRGVGDAVLQAFARHLRECVREGDTIARLGGDEFTVILAGIDTPDHAATVAQKILVGLSRPLAAENRLFHVTSSIGISIFPNDGQDTETLVKNADTAMYGANEIGRDTYQFYAEEMSNRFRERIAVEKDLRRAIDVASYILPISLFLPPPQRRGRRSRSTGALGSSGSRRGTTAPLYTHRRTYRIHQASRRMGIANRCERSPGVASALG